MTPAAVPPCTGCHPHQPSSLKPPHSGALSPQTHSSTFYQVLEPHFSLSEANFPVSVPALASQSRPHEDSRAVQKHTAQYKIYYKTSANINIQVSFGMEIAPQERIKSHTDTDGRMSEARRAAFHQEIGLPSEWVLQEQPKFTEAFFLKTPQNTETKHRAPRSSLDVCPSGPTTSPQ